MAARPDMFAPATAASRNSGPSYPAEVLRVLDGDTFEARVMVWPGLEARTKVRLRGIDAPELSTRCPAELALAQAARDALAGLLASGGVEVSAVSFDKYGGRVVAQASSRAVPDIGAQLLTAGLARHYGRGKRQGWC